MKNKREIPGIKDNATRKELDSMVEKLMAQENDNDDFHNNSFSKGSKK